MRGVSSWSSPAKGHVFLTIGSGKQDESEKPWPSTVEPLRGSGGFTHVTCWKWCEVQDTSELNENDQDARGSVFFPSAAGRVESA